MNRDSSKLRIALIFSRACIAFFLLTSAAVAQSDNRLSSSVTIFSETGHGSGVIVEKTGVVYTNYHVIENSKSLAIRLNNGDVFVNVDLLAKDELRDIAILKVSGFDLPISPLGNSNSVKVGDAVSVVGAPQGLPGTITTGIVSAKRRVDGAELIQIDAAISPGSSGGAVFNSDGQIIALAVSQYSDGQNLNFAVPVNYARGFNIDGDAIATFTSGEHLLLVADTGATQSSPTAAQRLSESDIVNVASLALGTDFVGPDDDGDYLAERENGGNIWLTFNEEMVFLTIYWDMKSVRINTKFLTEILRTNWHTSQVSVGFQRNDDDTDSLAIFFDSNIKWLHAKELAAAIDEITEVDAALLDLMLDNIPESDEIALEQHSSRPSFSQAKRSATSKKLDVMNEEFSIRIPRSWKMYKDEEIASNGGRARGFASRQDSAELVLLEEFGEQRITDAFLIKIAENYAAIGAAKNDQFLVLSSGERFIGNLRVAWVSVVQQSPGSMPKFYEFNMFPDVTDLLTIVTMGEDPQAVTSLGTDVIKSLQ